MRKLIFTAALCAFLSTPAIAADFKPYLGLDLQRMSLSYNNSYGIGGGNSLNGETLLQDNLDGVNIHVGSRISEFFGLELGYFQTQTGGKSIAAGTTVGPGLVAAANFKTDVKVRGFTLDGMGYLPLGDNKMFELIGTAGVSWSKGEVTLTVPGVGSGSEDESEFGLRLGGGGQININDKLNVRGLVRYQTADFSGVVDNAWIYSLGVNYTF